MAPKSTTHYKGTSKPTQEYSGQIDFRSSCNHNSWEVITFFSKKLSDNIADELIANNLLRDFTTDLVTLKTNKTVRLSFRPVDSKNNKMARRHLLKYLDQKKLSIVWKEYHHGYDINCSGHINRKWMLKPRQLPNFNPGDEWGGANL